jgi:anti-sigma regulatory factor (Ser/Thr protein kinase)
MLRLEVPARAEVLSLVRLQVGAAAALTGASLPDVEDLQLATEELCLSLLPLDGHPEGRLTVEVEWDDEAVLVRCAVDRATAARAGARAVEDDDLPEGVVERILDALVDEHGTLTEDGRLVAWLRARRGPARPDA